MAGGAYDVPINHFRSGSPALMACIQQFTLPPLRAVDHDRKATIRHCDGRQTISRTWHAILGSFIFIGKAPIQILGQRATLNV
jgi:hypothetical protein